MHVFKKLQTRLFLWYMGSLLLIGGFFLYAIHIMQIPHGFTYLIILFFVLAIIGFLIIYRLTQRITYLSEHMRHISSKNLDERIVDFKGEDELSELATSFNGVLDRLHEAFKREQQFIADMAHEMKTPIATLRSSLEVTIRKSRKPEEYISAINDSVKETNTLTSTLNKVLDLAWSEAEHNLEDAPKFDLSALVSENVEIAQKLAGINKITIRADIEKDVYMKGFRDKIAQAIMNVIENAIKYSTQKSIIDVTLEKVIDTARITITDQGIGIAPEDIPHIFDRFYRGNKSGKIFGSGLGLAITRSLVIFHHGSINVKSEAGKGSTFYISLPLS